MAREIFYGQEGFDKLLEGARKINDAVVVTMGAKGRNVLIEDTYGEEPFITKDGVTVAKNISLSDPVEKLAANLVKRASIAANNVSGDGSTSTVALTYGILAYGAEAVRQGANPVMLKRGIDHEVRETILTLDSIKTIIGNDLTKAKEVAYISANGDENVADIVSKVYEEVGVEGNVAIEGNVNSPFITYEKIEGVEFDRGFNHPYYITDIAKQECVYENPLILISDYRILSAMEIKHALEVGLETGRPVILICEEIDPQADATIAMNRLKGVSVATINAPEFGDRRLYFLEDLATITGGKFISKITGKTYDDVTIDDFGTCEKIVIDRDKTSIIGGKGKSEAIKERLEGVLSQIEETKDEENKKWLQKRYAKLKGGVAVIRVGGNSDIERRELRDRVEDAVNAVKCALKDGIIPGGGTPLMRISLSELSESDNKDKDFETGRIVLKKALKIPFNQILVNAGYTDPKTIAEEIVNQDNLNLVFNVSNDTFVDGIKEGVIDPTLVTKTALVKAASVAGTLLTTEATIVYEKGEPDKVTL